jgi:CHAD domain-containing protein
MAAKIARTRKTIETLENQLAAANQAYIAAVLAIEDTLGDIHTLPYKTRW